MHGGDRVPVLRVGVGPRSVHQAPSLRDQARTGGATHVRAGTSRSTTMYFLLYSYFKDCLEESIKALDYLLFMTHIAPAVTPVSRSGAPHWSGRGWLVWGLASVLSLTRLSWSPGQRDVNVSKNKVICTMYSTCLIFYLGRTTNWKNRSSEWSNIIPIQL